MRQLHESELGQQLSTFLEGVAWVREERARESSTDDAYLQTEAHLNETARRVLVSRVTREKSQPTPGIRQQDLETPWVSVPWGAEGELKVRLAGYVIDPQVPATVDLEKMMERITSVYGQVMTGGQIEQLFTIDRRGTTSPLRKGKKATMDDLKLYQQVVSHVDHSLDGGV